jgi:hypothetical protein
MLALAHVYHIACARGLPDAPDALEKVGSADPTSQTAAEVILWPEPWPMSCWPWMFETAGSGEPGS